MTAYVRKLLSDAVLAFVLFAGVLVAYLYHAQYRLYGAGGDTAPAELLPLSILDHHTLTFDWTAHDPGLTPRHDTGALYSFTNVGGHIISTYPIVPGLLNVPVYVLARWRGIELIEGRYLLSMITASLLTAASVVFVFLTLLNTCERRSSAILFTLVYAFGTSAFGMAIRGMWQHGPSLFFLSLGMWLLARDTAGSIALAGLPLGFAVWNRPTNTILVAALALFVLARRRHAALAFAVLGAIPIALMLAYSQVYWGSMRNLGQYSVNGAWFSTPFIEGLGGILVSPSRGLLIFSPIFVFAPLAVRRVLIRPLVAWSAAALPLFFLLYAKWYSWFGGWCFGYRLLTEAIVPLTLLLAVWWERRPWPRVTGALFTVALAWSVYTNVLGAYIYPCGFNWEPNRINEHQERLWSWSDGEIARCSGRVWSRVRAKL